MDGFGLQNSRFHDFRELFFGITRGRDEVPAEMNVFIVVLISHARELNATEVFFTKQKIPKHEKS